MSKTANPSTLAAPAPLPPTCPEHEQALLGAMIQQPADVISLALLNYGLTPEMFFTVPHQILAACLLDMYHQQQTIDLITVHDQLKIRGELDKIGGYLAIEAAYSACATTLHAPAYLDRVLDCHLLRTAIATSGEIIDRAMAQQTSGVNLLKESGQLFIDRISERFLALDNATLVAEIRADMDSQRTGNRPVSGLQTGLPNYDLLLDGLPLGLNVLAARPSMGKTSMEGTIVKNLCQRNQGVARVCFDMSSKRLLRRSAACVSGANLKKISQNFSRREEYEAFNSGLDQVQTWPMYILDNRAPRDIRQVCAWFRAMHARYDIKLMTLDYIQLLQIATTGKYINRNEQIGQISAMLKDLSFTLEIPMLVLSQLSRGSDRSTNAKYKRPALEDLRDSGAIEQDAVTVTALYQEEKYPDTQGHIGHAWVEVLKSQDGEQGRLPFWFVKPSFQYVEAEENWGYPEDALEVVDEKGRPAKY